MYLAASVVGFLEAETATAMLEVPSTLEEVQGVAVAVAVDQRKAWQFDPVVDSARQSWPAETRPLEATSTQAHSTTLAACKPKLISL